MTVVLKAFGLIVNFSPGKAEAMVCFNGKHAKLFKENIRQSSLRDDPDVYPRVTVSVPTIGDVSVCVVSK